jgi:hypothetical protein
MSVPFAFVHHANQYLITEGYENRPGLKAILGSPCANIGLGRVLHLHRVYRIRANIHVSDTLLEAIAWHVPAFLNDISKLRAGIGHCALQRVVAEEGSDQAAFAQNSFLLKGAVAETVLRG